MSEDILKALDMTFDLVEGSKNIGFSGILFKVREMGCICKVYTNTIAAWICHCMYDQYINNVYEHVNG